MATEELDEFEVLWPEYYSCHTHADDDHKPPLLLPAAAASMPWQRQRRAAQSKPVDVPIARAVLVIRWKDGTEDDLETDGGCGKITVPPHLLVSGPRLSGDQETAAYALLRSGRQLRRRGRDLRRLRNSVLRMTGFIEG